MTSVATEDVSGSGDRTAPASVGFDGGVEVAPVVDGGGVDSLPDWRP